VSGKYDPATGKLTYEARRLRNLTRPRLKHFEDRIDKTPPEKFGRASLFVDNVVGESCHGTFINSTSNDVKLTASSKNPRDSWGIEPPANSVIGPNGNQLDWRSDAPAFRGCKNDLTFQVQDGDGNTIATVETHLQKNFAVGFSGSYSCKSSSDRFTCSQVSADRDPQGLDLDVTWSLGGT